MVYFYFQLFFSIEVVTTFERYAPSYIKCNMHEISYRGMHTVSVCMPDAAFVAIWNWVYTASACQVWHIFISNSVGMHVWIHILRHSDVTDMACNRHAMLSDTFLRDGGMHHMPDCHTVYTNHYTLILNIKDAIGRSMFYILCEN